MKRNSIIFNEILSKSKFNKNERYNNHENENENDNALVRKYLSNEQSSENSNNINADKSINDNYYINKTESNIDDDSGRKDRKKLGIFVHNISEKNIKERYIDLNDINYTNNTLNQGLNKRISKGIFYKIK